VKPRVLISEPNAEVRRLLELTVERLGYEPVKAPSAGPPPAADAVLLEPAFPDSHSLLHRFGEDVPPVVCLSVYPREAGLAPPQSVAYLVKPSSTAAVGDALRNVFGR
jgi:CheY-like chemotaxis protein